VLTLNRAVMAAGSTGTPVHRHLGLTEALCVLAGSVDVLVQERVETLLAGDLVVFTPGSIHAFAPSAGGGADVLAVFTPSRERFDYYRLLGRLHSGEATPEDVRASSATFDNHYVASPVWAGHLKMRTR
jgi:uncharacterized cupin superfamily protein